MATESVPAFAPEVRQGGNEAARDTINIPHKHVTVSWSGEMESDPGGIGYPVNYEDLRNLKGRLLTHADASFADARQRKAQKDCIWQILQGWMHDIERSCGGDPLGPTVHTEETEGLI